MIDRAQIEAAFVREQDALLRDWFELLRIPSISADPARAIDCRSCAGWLVQRLARAGFTARILETSGNPVVFAERAGNPALPAVLFYGHYDVQPPEPLDAWSTPPFEPVLRNGRVYARGAEDNKGQLLYAVSAMDWLARSGFPLPTLKILLEGEEECGSHGISAGLESWRGQLAAKVLLVTDTNTVMTGVPTLVMGLRGLVHVTVDLSGPHHDLHSGVHGGLAPNPAMALARLITSLHDDRGQIAVSGFTDDVLPPTTRELELLPRCPFSADDYEKTTGVPPCAGDPVLAPVIRTGFSPCIDVNGLRSGYSGPGIKTIIPASATAKITARLAAGQDPVRCLELLVRHLVVHCPAGLKLDINEQGVGGPGFRLDPDAPAARTALGVLDAMAGAPAALLWEGASIPVVSALRTISGADPVLAGFGHDADRAHAPDESFSLEQMRNGFVFVGLFLSALAGNTVLSRP